ncbi:hypothetical protein BH23PAT2_BH23PAT2_08750 [soil metagenome]
MPITPKIILVASLLFAVGLGSVSAAVARGYKTDDVELRQGMMVALVSTQDEGTETVERASQENQANIIGFTTSVNSNLVNVVSKDQDVTVQLDGEGEVYVSDINGNIERGSRLVVSPVKGVLMSATGTSLPIVAVAQENFGEASSREVKKVQTTNGEKDSVIGKLRISLDYEVGLEEEKSSLEKLGQALTGKEVTTARVVAAFVVFIIVLVIEGGIIYGAVSSAITALGRNPLARKIIHKETFRVVGVALIVLVIGLGSVYLILWL